MTRKSKGDAAQAAAAPEGAPAGPGPSAKKKGKRGKTARQDAREIKKREAMRDALAFRKQGYTYAEIGDALEISTTTAFRYVTDAIREIPAEEAADVRTMQLDRLDSMLQKFMTAFEDNDAPDASLVDTILKLEDRRARLLGLYQIDGGPADSVFEAMGKRMAEMMQADKPVIRIEAGTPLPANPVL